MITHHWRRFAVLDTAVTAEMFFSNTFTTRNFITSPNTSKKNIKKNPKKKPTAILHVIFM